MRSSESRPGWRRGIDGPAIINTRLFIRGLAQLMGEHRRAIERVTTEQVDDPRPIEGLLAAAPLPCGDEDESNSEMIAAVGQATAAHAEALARSPAISTTCGVPWPIHAKSADR